MTLLWPAGLLVLGLIPAGLLIARRIEADRRRRVAALGGLGGSVGPAASRATWIERLSRVLVVAGFAVLAIAIARPQATVSLPRIEGTVVLTFDISASMLADDVSPSRMDAAKAVAKRIVDARPDGVVVGVVAFSDGGLAIQTPTSDPGPVLTAIDRLLPSRGTSVGQGISAALQAIAQAESDTPSSYYSNRSIEPTAPPPPVAPGSHGAAAIVLISDGENNERPDPMVAAQAAADQGIRIVTVGVGTTAGTTLELDGFRVQTALDEGALRQIADLTAGEYHPSAELATSAVYDGLARQLVARDTGVELTGLVAAAGLVLLIAGVAASLARAGRLP